jgi:hypothetical protein
MPIAEIVVPTDAMHHHDREQHENFFRLLPRFRQGKLPGDVFSRENRKRITVDHDAFAGGREVRGNASQELSEGRKKSTPRHDKNVRGKKGQERVLRSGKQEGQGKKPDGKGQQRVQKTEFDPKAARKRKTQAKVTKRSDKGQS